MIDEIISTTSPVPSPMCGYCRTYRWCPKCKTAETSGDKCSKCESELDPAPVGRTLAPLFEGDGATVEVLHEGCAKILGVLRAHRALLSAIGGHSLKPYDVALTRVVERGFTGWMDVRLTSDTSPTVIHSRLQIMLRSDNEPRRNGWASVWVSPDLVDLIKRTAGARHLESVEQTKAAQ
jgi:hypothetical protein